MKEIYVVTHTQATHHIDRLVGGWYDSELTEKGKADALICGARLQELELDGIPIISSDLARAKQTALAITECLGSPISYDARLREMSFGDAEGRSVADVGGAILSSDGDNRLDYRNTFGGETKRELASRLYEVMETIIATGRVIVCTHGYAATFLIACWIGMPIESVGYVNFRVQPGSITYLKEDDFFANRAVRYLSDVRHLDL
ncbi:histidine phosphatase family protein [Candidatus Bipolaricaulota bacterium]|nr:histidine phosphatase family protein [Candidatus Bipolaricaulota bacterium]